MTVNESMKTSALWGPKMASEEDSVGDKSCVLMVDLGYSVCWFELQFIGDTVTWFWLLIGINFV